MKCPDCGSIKKEKKIDNFDFTFKDPKGTDRWNGSHAYRFGHTLPKAAAERENAMKKSHMGSEPFSKIDDISSGKHFGQVK